MKLMKNVVSKIPAILGMLSSLICFGFMIASLVASIVELVHPWENGGNSPSFGFWIFSVIAAFFCIIPYFIDAILSIIKSFMKTHTLFNVILSVLLIGFTPMLFFVGATLGINIIIWNVYHIAIFVLEIISIFKHHNLFSPKTKKQEKPTTI